MAIELFHVGEVLVAEILSRLHSRKALYQVREAVRRGASVSLLDDLRSADIEFPVRFYADSASLVVRSGGTSFSCDGAQTIDVLCAGRNGLAVAIEVKLGETRMTRAEFRKRFCIPCEESRHLDSRLRGSMVAVLERDLPFLEESELAANVNGDEWRINQAWWLVVRQRVWRSWRGVSPVRSARVMLFEDLARAYGGEREFDNLVTEILGSGFASRWGVYE